MAEKKIGIFVLLALAILFSTLILYKTLEKTSKLDVAIEKEE